MKPSFVAFLGRVVVSHTLVYVAVAVVLSLVPGYRELTVTQELAQLLRPEDSPWHYAAPFLQPVRGLVLAFVFWPVWGGFVTARMGWLKLALVLIGVGVLGGPLVGAGSFEGVLRTGASGRTHLAAVPEALAYAVLFSTLLVTWDRSARRKLQRATEEGKENEMRAGSRIRVRAATIALLGYLGIAVGGYAVVWLWADLGFAHLTADPYAQLYAVGMALINYGLAYLLGSRLFVHDQTPFGLLSKESLGILLLLTIANLAAAAGYYAAPHATVSVGAGIVAQIVPVVLMWAAAMTLLPGVRLVVADDATSEADEQSGGVLAGEAPAASDAQSELVEASDPNARIGMSSEEETDGSGPAD